MKQRFHTQTANGATSPRLVITSIVATLFCPPTFAADPELGQIVVTATRQAARSNELLSDVSIINRAEIEQSGHGSLEQLLASQAGVEFAANGGPGTNSYVYLRGANAKQTLVLIDGLRIGSASSGDVAFSRLPLEQIERIEILRGPASSLYGADAIGGVIQIFTRRGEGPARINASTGFGSYNTSQTTAGAAGGDKLLSWNLQAGYAHTDGFNALRNPANSAYNPDRDGYRNSNFGANLAVRPAAGQEFGLNLLHSTGTSHYDISPKTKDYANAQDLSSFGLYARNRVNDLWTSTLRLGRSTDDSTNLTNGVPSSVFRTDQDQISWQNDVKLPIGQALLAAEHLHQEVSGSTAYPVNSRNIRSLLAGWKGNLGAHRLQANLRRDENSQFGGRNTGFVAYGYQFSDDWRAHASAGTAFRAPSFNELYFPDTGYGSGNPKLKPEFARNREIGATWERASQRFSAIYFDNRISDLIATWPPANVSSATLRGLSLSHAAQWQDWQWSASADLQRPRDNDTGMRLARRADRQLKTSLSYPMGAWRLGGEWQLVGERYDDAANTKRMGGYGIVNLFADYRLERDWTLFARANNVFDKTYELVRDFATPGANLFVGIRYAPR